MELVEGLVGCFLQLLVVVQELEQELVDCLHFLQKLVGFQELVLQLVVEHQLVVE